MLASALRFMADGEEDTAVVMDVVTGVMDMVTEGDTVGEGMDITVVDITVEGMVDAANIAKAAYNE